jgi:hypothetical protein
MKPLRLIHLCALCSLLFVSCENGDTNVPVDPVPTTKEPATINKVNKTAKSSTTVHEKKKSQPLSLEARLGSAKEYVLQKGYSTEYCFLIDMGIKSGKNRFFVYNLETDNILMEGLVAHGSCNTQFISQARFSNAPDCGCTSMGKYKVGSFYMGEWGKSFRLYGLDATNSNALKRGIVLHGHDCVPDEEIYPRVLCNSFGCPMVSKSFFGKLSEIIEGSEKPILLWIYN